MAGCWIQARYACFRRSSGADSRWPRFSQLWRRAPPHARGTDLRTARASPHPPTSHRFRALSERERVRLPTPSHAPAWPLRWLTASVGRGSRPRGARRGLTTSLEGSDRRRTSSSTRRRQREQAQSPAGRTTRVAPHLPPTRTSAHPHIITATSHSAFALLARFQALWRQERSNFAHAKARPRPGRCPARTSPDTAPRIAHGNSALARACGVTLAALPTTSVALTRRFVGNACRHFSCEAPRHGAPPHDRSFDNEPPRAGQRRLNQ